VHHIIEFELRDILLWYPSFVCGIQEWYLFTTQLVSVRHRGQ